MMNAHDRTDVAGTLQFRLRDMFAFTALVALFIWLVVAAHPVIAGSVIIILTVSIPAFITTVLVYGKSLQRTFCIGAIFPTGGLLISLMWVLGIGVMNYDSPGRGYSKLLEEIGEKWPASAAISWVLAFILGISSVVIRLLIERNRIDSCDDGESN